jgi:membrane associated rhomboid family serine protease
MEPNDYAAQSALPPAAPGEQRPLPIVTIAVLGITAIITGLQFVYPAVLSALRRNPTALVAGEWWRMITPLFVHSDGWPQFIINSLGIALVGPTIERRFGHLRWLVLYFGAGLVAEAISYAWDPYGAGASIALCGLIGGLVLGLLAWTDPVPLPALLFVLYFVAGLIGYAAGGIIAAVILCVLIGVALPVLIRGNAPPWTLDRFVAATGLLGALVLTTLYNNHGPPLIVGACLAALMLWRGPTPTGAA